MAGYALRLDNSTDTAPRVRMGDALSLQHAGPLNTRSGLRPDGGGGVAAVDGSMAVTVDPFTAWVDGGTSDVQGGYPFVLDDQATLSVADGDASLPRVDTVAVVIREDAFDASGDTSATVEIVEGVPGGSAPALPDTALPLRDIEVPAGASSGTGGLSSSNIGADRRRWLAGGILPVSGATERDELGAQPGQAVYRADTGKVELYDGAEWHAFKRDDGLFTQHARESVSTNSSGRGSVVFPEAFAGAPTVTVTVEHGGYSANITGSPTSTGIDFQINHWSSGPAGVGSFNVGWTATGTKA